MKGLILIGALSLGLAGTPAGSVGQYDGSDAIMTEVNYSDVQVDSTAIGEEDTIDLSGIGCDEITLEW